MTSLQIQVLNGLLKPDYEGEQLKLGDKVIDKAGNVSEVEWCDKEGGFMAGDTPISEYFIDFYQLRKYYGEAF